MKVNFEVDDLTITYGKVFEYFDKDRNINLELPPFFGRRNHGELNALFADAWKKYNDTTFHSASLDSPPIKEREDHQVSVYITANFALGNKYKYPRTEEQSEAQNVLCFIQAGALSLIVERIEGALDRKLDEVEERFLVASLNDLTYSVYEEQHGGDEKDEEIPTEDCREISKEEKDEDSMIYDAEGETATISIDTGNFHNDTKRLTIEIPDGGVLHSWCFKDSDLSAFATCVMNVLDYGDLSQECIDRILEMFETAR